MMDRWETQRLLNKSLIEKNHELKEEVTALEKRLILFEAELEELRSLVLGEEEDESDSKDDHEEEDFECDYNCDECPYDEDEDEDDEDLLFDLGEEDIEKALILYSIIKGFLEFE